MSAFTGGMNPNMNPNYNPMMGGGQGFNPNMPPGMMNPNMMPQQQQNQPPPPLKYKRFSVNGKGPFKTYASDAGFDLAASEDGEIPAGTIAKKISTGIGLELPTGLFGLIRDRSSLAEKGLIVVGGVIDTDYRGEVIVMLTNMGKESFVYKSGDRIAQVIILPSGFFNFVEASELDATMRSSGGFGSTGQATPSSVNPSVTKV